ncbi:hypothetical protein OAL24_00660 [Oenococcus sicerae]|nr:hypothetical protein OAL24_00660 [Oenococcus sicerae]
MSMTEFNYPSLAIIVPVNNEEDNIVPFYENVQKNLTQDALKSLPGILSNLKVDIWYIDDGSVDKSLNEIKQIQQVDSSIHFVSFSRNFGKEAAIYAGLNYAKNYDFIALMDVDLQDPPALLAPMLKKLVDDQLDIIATRRLDRKGENPVIQLVFDCLLSFSF